jgi:hypothetical protein
MPRPMTPARREALQNGRRFYVGAPCQHGHGAAGNERYTSTNACRQCVRLQARPERRKPATVDTLAELLG